MHNINLQLVFASISLLSQYQLLYRGNAYTRKYQYLEIVLKFFGLFMYLCRNALSIA